MFAVNQVFPCYQDFFTAAKVPLKTAYEAASASAKRCRPGQTCHRTLISTFVRALNNAFFKIKDHEGPCEAGDNVQFKHVVGYMRVWSGQNGSDRVQRATAAVDANLTLP